MTMRRRAVLVAAVFAGMSLGACGFHLRTESALPPQLARVHVSGADLDLVARIAERLAARGALIAPGGADLRITAATAYALTYAVQYRLTARGAPLRRHATTASRTRGGISRRGFAPRGGRAGGFGVGGGLTLVFWLWYGYGNTFWRMNMNFLDRPLIAVCVRALIACLAAAMLCAVAVAQGNSAEDINYLDQFFAVLIPVLIPVLISLISAGVGGAIAWKASVAVHRRQARVQKIAMLRSKLEVVVLACRQIHEWQAKQIWFYVLGEASFRDPNVYSRADAPEMVPEAFFKIQCMQLLYFAEKLEVQTRQLEVAIIELGHAMIAIFKERFDSMRERPGQDRYPPPADWEKRVAPIQKRLADAQNQFIVVARELKDELDSEQTKI